MIRAMKLVYVTIIATLLAGCGIQSIPQSKNQVEASLAEITNQYKRRADLIPNLVNVVKGFASHERETLEGVVTARAKATQVTIDASKASPDQIAKYKEAQGQLSNALGRLLMLTETYPNLKADANFRELQVQLEGTENRIAVARQRYIQSIKELNNLIMTPPTSWTNSIMYHYEKMPQWDLEPDEKAKAEKAPEVKF